MTQCLVRFTLLSAISAPLAGFGQQILTANDSVPASRPAETHCVENGSIAEFQSLLLGVAFDAVSAMPLNPHVKNRSRGQEEVVAACLELQQPERALEFLKQIADWRRGASYAELALYCAKHADQERALEFVDIAARESHSAADWRRDAIGVKIAMAYERLGQSQRASSLEEGFEDSEAGKVDSVRAMLATPDNVQALMESLDRAIDTGKFDRVKNALEAYALLFNRFYEDVERRALIAKTIKARWDLVPIVVRISLLTTMAEFALDHKDQSSALALVTDAQAIRESVQWLAEDRIPLMAQLAALRFRAGDQEKARSGVTEALSLFVAQRELIVNIYRARALRPIAEAYWAMGDQAMALAVYKKAIEAGVENPNSRPRADDLSATCCSMALRGFEPDAELWTRIRQIRDGLGDPW